MSRVRRVNTAFGSGFSHGSFQWPTPQPFFKRRSTDPDTRSPIHDTHGFTVKGDINIATKVSVLLPFGGPTNIARFVVAFIIRIAIQRVRARWTFTHVGKEVLKFMPSLANLNAFVIFIIRISKRITGAAKHVLPTVISQRLAAQLASVPMNPFAAQTSARFCPTAAQDRCINNGFSAARAQTNPSYLPISARRCSVNDGELPKKTPRQVLIVFRGRALFDKIGLHRLFSLTVDSWCRAAGYANTAAASL